MFITFEGPDGSGKTTALKRLRKFLDQEKIDYVFTREPGGSDLPEADKIRQIILDPTHKIPRMAEAILYAADRRLNLEKNIWPALKAHKLVLCDRYLDSSIAYQGYARGIGVAKVVALQDVITEKTYPDLTIFFDIKPQAAALRMNQRLTGKDRLELEGAEFQEKVYLGYQEAMKVFPQRFKSIDASQSKTKVFEEVKKIVLAAIKKNS